MSSPIQDKGRLQEIVDLRRTQQGGGDRQGQIIGEGNLKGTHNSGFCGIAFQIKHTISEDLDG